MLECGRIPHSTAFRIQITFIVENRINRKPHSGRIRECGQPDRIPHAAFPAFRIPRIPHSPA
jgi:hypothetical protein